MSQTGLRSRRQRRPENKGLPARWQWHNGAFYYRVPPGLEAAWDGKKRFRLGKALHEAHAAYAARIGAVTKVRSVDDLLDRYSLEVTPAKPPKTQANEVRYIRLLRAVFGKMPLTAIKPGHVYGYVSRRKKKVMRDGIEVEVPALTAAHREIEVLSHAFTKAVQWGEIDRHPFRDQVRLDGDLALRPRTRYVEDWEVLECLSLDSRRKKGSVHMIQAYIRLKLLTGLARSDLLRLRAGEHLREDGIHVTRHKTQGTTGKATVYTYKMVPERRDAVEQAIKARPCLSPFLFCNRRGEGYIDEKTGQSHGWDSMWQRFMDRVLRETSVRERFTEHDLRAKVGSDAESLDKARALLQHADQSTTHRVYRRKAERV
jgi:integrase